MSQFKAEHVLALRRGRKSRTVRFVALIVMAASLAVAVQAQSRQRKKRNLTPAPKVAACLPRDVTSSVVVDYRHPRNITVAEKLKALKAHCYKGRLVDSQKREIRFFRKACWGFPPPNYQEIRAHENRDLKALKAKYTVIVIDCDPRIP